MKVKTTVNSKALNEVKKYLINPKSKLVLLVCMILFFIVDIYYACIHEYKYAIIIFVMLLALVIEIKLIEKRIIKRNINRIKELYDSDESKGTIKLEDNNIIVKNDLTNSEISMKYDIFVHVYETENYIAIFTKSWQFIMVDKSQFDDKQKEEFIDLLKQKGKNIKM